jgi:hypothetical protein
MRITANFCLPSRMLVNRGFARDLFDVDIEHAADRQIDGLGVHHVAFEENFDPFAILGYRKDYSGGAFDCGDRFVSDSRLR